MPNGVGSNQYRSRGSSRQIKPIPTAGLGLFDQIDAGDLAVDRLPCGEVWSTDCQAWVYPPGYTHDDHPSSLSKVLYIRGGGVSDSLLGILASDIDSGVRLAVAACPASPPGVLEYLSGDSILEVRLGVAENVASPPEVLTRLVSDPSHIVSETVASNLSAPPALLAQLAASSDSWMRQIVASHPNSSPDLLEHLALDDDPDVRYEVATSPVAAIEVLARLALDADSFVAHAAVANINLPEHLRGLAKIARPR